MRIGITGHQTLEDPSSWLWVKSEINSILDRVTTLVIGITSLAVGADQLFTELVLQHGGIIEVIIPFEGYDLKFKEGQERKEYNRLLNAASKVEILKKAYSEEESYLAAGKRVVDLANCLIAVWDGKPAAGLGGTADVVLYAKEVEKKIIHVNPLLHTIVELE